MKALSCLVWGAELDDEVTCNIQNSGYKLMLTSTILPAAPNADETATDRFSALPTLETGPR